MKRTPFKSVLGHKPTQVVVTCHDSNTTTCPTTSTIVTSVSVTTGGETTTTNTTDYFSSSDMNKYNQQEYINRTAEIQTAYNQLNQHVAACKSRDFPLKHVFQNSIDETAIKLHVFKSYVNNCLQSIPEGYTKEKTLREVKQLYSDTTELIDTSKYIIKNMMIGELSKQSEETPDASASNIKTTYTSWSMGNLCSNIIPNLTSQPEVSQIDPLTHKSPSGFKSSFSSPSTVYGIGPTYYSSGTSTQFAPTSTHQQNVPITTSVTTSFPGSFTFAGNLPSSSAPGNWNMPEQSRQGFNQSNNQSYSGTFAGNLPSSSAPGNWNIPEPNRPGFNQSNNHNHSGTHENVNNKPGDPFGQFKHQYQNKYFQQQNPSGAGAFMETESNELPSAWQFKDNTEDFESGDPIKACNNGLVPKFDGKAENYFAWRATFINLVHCSRKICYKQKYALLIQCIDSQFASESMGFLEPDYNGYVAMINRLEEKYGDPQVLVHLYRDKIGSLNILRTTSVVDFEKYSNLLESYIHALKASKLTGDIYNHSTFALVCSPVPPMLANAVCQYTDIHGKNAKSVLFWAKATLQSLRTQSTWRRKPQYEQQNTNRKPFRYNKSTLYLANEDPNLINFGELELEDSSQTTEDTIEPELFPGKSQEEVIAIINDNKCIVCPRFHKLSNCDTFKKMDIPKRWEIVKESARCIRCLGVNHTHKECFSNRKCNVKGCKELHHFMLHANGERVPPVDPILACISAGIFTLRFVIFILKNKYTNKNKLVGGIIDSGASRSYLYRVAAKELELQGYNLNLRISGFQQVNHNVQATVSTMTACDCKGNPIQDITCRVLDSPLGEELYPINWNNHKHKWEHLKDISFPNIDEEIPIVIIIGNDNNGLLTPLDYRSCNGDGPLAIKTPLGWTCAGPTDPNIVENLQSCTEIVLKSVEDEEERVDDLLRQQWAVDSLGIQEKEYQMSKEEQNALTLLEKTTCLENNQYKVGVLWKPGKPKLECNYNYAHARLRGLLKSFEKHPEEIRKSYGDTIKMWESKGYIRKAKSNEQKQGYYLPHFFVHRPEKTTSKIRPVLDGAATYMGKSLNDDIMCGPKLINDLVNVLLRFRRHKVALVGDIKEMFLQIKMYESDQIFHKILWIDDEGKIVEYIFLVHVFGNRGSPCVAIYTTQRHAEKFNKEYPRAVEAMTKSSIVDDVLDSFQTSKEAITVKENLVMIMQQGGFNMTKLSSNDKEVLETIPMEHRAPNFELELDFEPTEIKTRDAPTIKTLGIIWISSLDIFTFKIEIPKNQVWTKRSILSVASKLFDPLGFISPYTVTARVYIQELWLKKFTWDEHLPETITKTWANWLTQLPYLEKLKIQRCISHFSEIDSYHIFVDASGESYAAACYAVTKSNQERNSRLVMSKAKVAPLKTLSIPRLELLAAVMGIQLGLKLSKTYGISMSGITFWTDAKNVLCWLQLSSRIVGTFVATRVGYITEHTSSKQWNWISTNDNPADLPTRGKEVTELFDNRLWWEGPSYLLLDNIFWPQQPKLSGVKIEELEIKKEHLQENLNHESLIVIDSKLQENNKFLLPTSSENLIPNLRFSNYNKQVRAIARIKRWAKHAREKRKDEDLTLKQSFKPEISAEEFIDAENAIIAMHQLEYFQKEIITLEKQGRLNYQHSLMKLYPQINTDGLMRVCGRVSENSHLSKDAGQPIILNTKTPLAKLLIDHTHKKVLKHAGGPNVLQSKLFTKFWLVQCRRYLIDYCRNCVICRRNNPHIQVPIMANLPEYRTPTDSERSECFNTTGIDVGGPFLTKMGRGYARQKRYFLLFTCARYRCVRLEMLFDMSTDSFILAFERFLVNNPRPKTIISDNGTNFVRGELDLRTSWENLIKENPQLGSKYPKINWVFIPPKAPHFGGFYERMIGSTKRSLYAMIKAGELNDDMFMTCLKLTEGILNSRPIGQIPVDGNDPEILTPGHFLRGESYESLTATPTEWEAAKSWAYLQKLMNRVWKRFVEEVTPKLHIRSKWLRNTPNLQVGQIVIVLDLAENRNEWPLGRIESVIENKSDKVVRIVNVIVNGKTYRRAAEQIIPLFGEKIDQLEVQLAEKNITEIPNDQ